MDKEDVKHTNTHTHRQKAQDYSVKETNESLFATMLMDLESILPSEMSDRERQILYIIMYMGYIKIKQMNVCNKIETDPQIENGED